MAAAQLGTSPMHLLLCGWRPGWLTLPVLQIRACPARVQCPLRRSKRQLLATGWRSLRCPAHTSRACLPSLSAVQFQEQLLATGRRSLRGLDASVLCGSALQVRAWGSRRHAGMQCSKPGAAAVHEAGRMSGSPSGSSNPGRRGLRGGWSLPCGLQERSDFLTMNCAGGGIDMVGVSSVKGGCVDISFAGETGPGEVPR